MGYFEGVTGYLFVANDPIAHLDHEGLACTSSPAQTSFWRHPAPPTQDPRYRAANPLERLLHPFGKMLSVFAKECIPFPWIRDPIGILAHSLTIDSRYTRYIGYNEEKRSAVYTFGENPLTVDGRTVGIVLLNGIANSVKDAQENAVDVQRAVGLGTEVISIHNSNHGFCSDILEAICNMLHIPTHVTSVTVHGLRTALASHDELLVLPHSQGGLIFHDALQYLSPQERSRIHVRTFGSAKMITPHAVHSAVNFVSEKDLVPYACCGPSTHSARRRGDPHIRFLHSHTLFDHAFLGATYSTARNKELREFFQKNEH